MHHVDVADITSELKGLNQSHLVLGSVRMFSKLFILLRSFFLSENRRKQLNFNHASMRSGAEAVFILLSDLLIRDFEVDSCLNVIDMNDLIMCLFFSSSLPVT